MQVATCAGAQPWCATVYFAHDNIHNLYWISDSGARHSFELVRNERVAGAIVLPQTYGQPPQGIQFEGIAREITDPQEIAQLSMAYAQRYGRSNIAAELTQPGTTRRLYQIKPTEFTLFDQADFPGNPRQTWQPAPYGVEPQPS